MNENTTLVVNAPGVLANDTDPDNDPLTIPLSSSPANGTLNLNADGSFSYTPDANFNGIDSFFYYVSDGVYSRSSARVTITVNALNRAPIANGGSITTNEDTPSSAFMLTGSDADNDPLTFQIVTAPAKRTYNAATGVYTPNLNANGGESFTFIAKDAVSQSAPATVSITINPVNDAPTAANQSVTTDEDAAKSSGNNGTWTVSGVADAAAGSYLIRVTIMDADQGSASTSFTIGVTKETTATDYTGDFDLMTAGPAINTASVRLAVKLTQDPDNSPGDLTKATVTFKIFKFNATTASFTIANVPVDSNGDAELFYTLPADVYTIRVKLDAGNCYWTAAPINDGMLNITVPNNELRSSGGGWLADAGSANGRAHFAFSVSATKNGSPKGNVSFSYKGADGFTYLVKSNSWQNGYLQFAAEPNVSPALYTRSNLKGSCTVQKIDPATGSVVESFGGYTFEIFTRDGDLLNPRQSDSYSIMVRSNTNAVFHQVGSPTSLVTLGGGNITNKAK